MAEAITNTLINLANFGTWILEDIWNAVLFFGTCALIGIGIKTLFNPYR